MENILKYFYSFLLLFFIINCAAIEPPNVIGTWTCSQKDCKVEIYKVGTTYEAKLIWARKELDEKGNSKLDVKNPDPAKRKLPIIGSKTLWNAKYNTTTGYFEGATAYRNGKYFCGKFKLNQDGSITITGYNCTLKFLKFSDTWTRVK